MVSLDVAGAVSIELASKQDVKDESDKLFDRIMGGRKRAIPRRLSGVWDLAAANYTNGAEGIVNLGSPADGRIWLVRSCSQFAVRLPASASVPPSWLATVNPPDCHLCVGSSPMQITAGVISDRPNPSSVIVPFVNPVDSVLAGTSDPSFSQPFVVNSGEELFAYFLATAALNLATRTLFMVNATVFEVLGTEILVGGV